MGTWRRAQNGDRMYYVVRQGSKWPEARARVMKACVLERNENIFVVNIDFKPIPVNFKTAQDAEAYVETFVALKGDPP